MKSIMDLKNERKALWEQTKAFVDKNRDPKTGLVNAAAVPESVLRHASRQVGRAKGEKQGCGEGQAGTEESCKTGGHGNRVREEQRHTY